MEKLSKVLGVVGAIVGIVSGIIGFAINLWPKPSVHMTISKAPLWVSRAVVAFPRDMESIYAQKDLGTVVIEVTNESSADLTKPQLQLRNLTGFRGMVVADGTLGTEEARSRETLWQNQISRNPDNPVLDLPDIRMGGSLKVQAFGSNWDKVDPVLLGSSRPRQVWIVSHPDSLAYTLLVEFHLWWIFIVLLIATSIMLAKRRTVAHGAAV